MKNRVLILSALLFSGALLVSCGDSTDSASEDLQYADLTIEQNKTKIQDDALATMEKMQGMSTLQAISLMPQIMQYAQMMGGGAMEGVVSMLQPMTGFSAAPVAAGSNAMIAAQKAGGQLSALLQYLGGTYTYNSQTQSFERVAATDHVTMIFPVENSPTNNGKLELTNLTFKTVTVSDSIVEIPLSFDLKLYTGNALIFSFEFDAAVNSNNNPTLLSTRLYFSEGYVLTEKLTNNESAANFEASMKFGDVVLLNASLSSAGTFTQEQLKLMDESDDASVEDIIKNANASFQLGNLKLTGIADLKTVMADKTALIGEQDNPATKADADKLIASMNKHIKLVLSYASEKTAIAKSNFVAVEGKEWTWDEKTSKENEITVYRPEFQMLFSDGSAMSETFVSTGFEQLQQAVETMLNNMETNYGGLK